MYDRDALLNDLDEIDSANEAKAADARASFDRIDLALWGTPTAESVAVHAQTKRERISGFYGVAFNQGKGLWDAKLRVNKLKRSIGSYATKEVAAEAYDYAATKVYGTCTS